MEVIRLVTADLQPFPTVTELPVSPVDGLEPLLTIDQLMAWTRYSRSTIQNYRKRAIDPLPQVGTEGLPRFLPSEVLAWLRREYASTAESR